MKVGTFSKQPRERLTHTIQYAEALEPGDEVVSVVSCEVAPAGLAVTALVAAGDRVRLWTEDGTDGVRYTITVIVDTQHGERLEDEVVCVVKEI